MTTQPKNCICVMLDTPMYHARDNPHSVETKWDCPIHGDQERNWLLHKDKQEGCVPCQPKECCENIGGNAHWRDCPNMQETETIGEATSRNREWFEKGRQAGREEERATWINQKANDHDQHISTAVYDEVLNILQDELVLAHTTESGKTSRLTSAINRVNELRK